MDETFMYKSKSLYCVLYFVANDIEYITSMNDLWLLISPNKRLWDPEMEKLYNSPPSLTSAL
jgi:hypothetical protein